MYIIKNVKGQLKDSHNNAYFVFRLILTNECALFLGDFTKTEKITKYSFTS